MIGSLSGTIRSVEEEAVLLDVQGVGYRVAVLPRVRAAARPGENLCLRTHLHVREDDLALYGFADEEDLALFRLLLAVPGVGPKSAMNILSLAPVAVLARAIAAGQASLLEKVSGIGRKTAERIIVELKARLAAESGGTPPAGMPHAEVVEALIALGYTAAQARDAVRVLPEGITTVEEGIRAALRSVGRGETHR